MKKFYILVLGEASASHLNGIFKIAQEHKGEFCGFEFLPFINDESYIKTVSKRIDELYNNGIEPIIIKGFNIHTEDYIRPLIKYYKNKHPEEKFFLSHCAVFNNFILTDGALLTKYTEENIRLVIMNAVELRDKLWSDTDKSIAMLNAGGDTNPNTAPDYWMEIYNNLPKVTPNYKLEMSQLDVAISRDIRIAKLGESSSLPSILIPSCINEGNSIWKTLTVVAKQSLAGIVMGLPMYIGLTSRTDSEDSIYQTLNCLVKMMIVDNNL